MSYGAPVSYTSSARAVCCVQRGSSKNRGSPKTAHGFLPRPQGSCSTVSRHCQRGLALRLSLLCSWLWCASAVQNSLIKQTHTYRSMHYMCIHFHKLQHGSWYVSMHDSLSEIYSLLLMAGVLGACVDVMV